MDLKSSFLHGEISEEIFMEQPPSFVIDSTMVYQLKKSLYSLKKVPRVWYAKIDNLFLQLSFKLVNVIPAYMYSILMETL
jgi:hypothetical protein